MKRVFEGHFAVGVGGRSASGDELLFHRWPTLGIDFRCFVADPSVLLRRRDCMPTTAMTRSGGVLREVPLVGRSKTVVIGFRLISASCIYTASRLGNIRGTTLFIRSLV